MKNVYVFWTKALALLALLVLARFTALSQTAAAADCALALATDVNCSIRK
jgi:hypothetical protein